MNRIIKFPTAMVTGDYTASSLVLDGGSVIDQCIATAGDKGTFFLEQHLLYVVLGDEVRLTCGKQTCVIRKNEMVLLRRAHSVSYEKQGDKQTGLFESLLFAITDELISDFLTQQHITIPQMTEELGVKVSPMSERLVAYCWSLSPYFNDPSQTNPGLLRLKVMELLYNVMDCSKKRPTSTVWWKRTTHRPSRSKNWLISQAVLSPTSSATSRAFTEKRLPNGFVRSDSQKHDRCCRPHRCL